MDPVSLKAILGVGGSLFGGMQAKKAAARYADAIVRSARIASGTLERLAAPGVDAMRTGISGTKSVLSNVLLPQMGKESQFLKTGLESSLRDIGRAERSALGESSHYWKSSGNVGRGRGEMLRIGRQSEEMRTNARLGFGQAQESYMETNLERVLRTYSGLTSAGSASIGPAVQGANILAQGGMTGAQVRNEGAQQLYGDLGAVGGLLIGDWLKRRDAKEEE